MVSFKSLCKIVLKSILVIALTVFVIECINTFFQRPTYTDITQVDQTEASFPAITLCPHEKEYPNREVWKEHKFKGVDARCFKDPFYEGKRCNGSTSWNSRKENVTSQELFDLITYRFPEMINIKTSLIRTDLPFNKNKTKLYMKNKTAYDVVEQRNKFRGKCWTILIHERITKLRIRSITLHFEMPIEYQLHLNRQFKYLYQQTEPIESVPGSVVQVSVREIKMLPYTKRNCLLEHEWSDEHFYKMAQMDNCTVPWAKNNTNICTENLDIERVVEKDSQNERVRQQGQPCHTLNIVYQQIPMANHTCQRDHCDFFHIKFGQTVTEAVEQELYGSRSMFAEIGGFVGIFLGFSLLDLVDVLVMALGKSLWTKNRSNHARREKI